jgi:hypothetical protein
MRAYAISITDPMSGKLWVPPSLASINTGFSYASMLNGKPLDGALNVEMDIQVATYAQPAGGSFIEISGVSVQEISQAYNLNGFNIAVYGGMQAGLPLATADYNQKQYGLLVQGSIYQAYGNWIGTQQTLDLSLQPPMGTNSAPVNLTFDWASGVKLSDALTSTFTAAYPNFTPTINISSNLVLPQRQVGYHYTLNQFAQYVKKMSAAIIGGSYTGVNIAVQGAKILVDDGTVPATPKMINFYDLIGQPTWLDDATIQFKCPMRADLNQLDYIQFPAAAVISGVNAPSPFTNAKATFQGQFQVSNIRHVGNFRQPDADSWCSVIDCFTNPVAAS